MAAIIWLIFLERPWQSAVISALGMPYLTLATLILFMASLPIKMVLRWTINLKYLVAIPEYFFNI